MNRGRLVVVSNRLPVTMERIGNQLQFQPSSGGLVSALLPVFKQIGGCWIGWPGTDCDPEVAFALREQSCAEYCFQPVFLNDTERRCFYHGWANEIIWPLFHDLSSYCNFDPEYWAVYHEASEKFADVVECSAGQKDFVWVHDYHLMMLADALRFRGMNNKMAYFHHIPFPAPDMFEKLPWRSEILHGLLQFNSLGFQTERDSKNFVGCALRCLPGAQLIRHEAKLLVRFEGRYTAIGTFPISIDYRAFADDAAHNEVAARALEIRGNLEGKKIVLGVDRLDYTKGAVERLLAYRTLLKEEPGLRGRVTLLQLVVPSREGIARYGQLKNSIKELVKEINHEFGASGWTPVIGWHHCVSRSELLALYRAADVALITPLKDGMNLVAKEFCAARVETTGVLVLSEFAGTALQLANGALLVNPYDSKGMAATLSKALRMSEPEQQTRMQQMQRTVQQSDVFHWCESIWHDVGFNGPCLHSGRRQTKEFEPIARAG